MPSLQWERKSEAMNAPAAKMDVTVKAELVQRFANARVIVADQSCDEGIWFIAETAAEAYLQHELRRLHEAIEGKSTTECAIDALTSQHEAKPEVVTAEELRRVIYGLYWVTAISPARSQKV